MKIRLLSTAALLFASSGYLWASPAQQQQASETAAPGQTSTAGSDAQRRSEIYYDFTMGHLYEQQYAASGGADDATQALQLYKDAFALDPSSPVIGERLAEMYFLSRRIREAIDEAQDIIRRNPDDIPARRLLARIYLRSLGDLTNASEQLSTINLAIGQLSEIFRLDPSDVESGAWLARLYRLSNQDDRAEQVLRSVLAVDSENKDAAEQLAQLLIDRNNAAAAIALLGDFLERAPNADLYDRLGDAYAQTQDAGRAQQAYQRAVELEPDQASHRHHLAQSLYDQGQDHEALDQYLKLVELEPDVANNYVRLSEIYRHLHQLDKAEQQVALAKERAPGNLEVIYNQAAIYQDQGRFDDAVRVLSDAVAELKAQVEFTPGRRRSLAILYQLLGQLYRDEENYSAAVNTFDEMVRLGPEEDLRARMLIIDTYRAGHDLPHAFEEAQKALGEHPSDRGLVISQALLYGENKQPDKAAKALKPLLNNSSGDLEIYMDLAQVFAQGRRFNDAEQALHSAEKVADRPADKEMIGFLLGGVFERQKKYDQAELAFKGVLAINARNAATLNYYGYMLADRGVRLDEAANFARRALEDDPSNAAYLDTLGWALYKQNKLPEAEDYIRRATEHESHDPAMLSHLGDVLAKQGRTDLAIAQWEKSLAEWRRAVPADFEEDKVAELEQKISSSKRHIAQQKPVPQEKSR